MTLVAAFQHDNVPLILGDFLLTAQDSIGTRKKVHLISPNFVVGWTGSKLVASAVLRDLNDQFRDEYVTRSTVEDFLTEDFEEELPWDYLIK